MINTNPSVEERFWSRVGSRDEPGGRRWIGKLWKSGRGRFVVNGRRGSLLEVPADRWVWEQANGPLDDHKDTSQTCGYRDCVELSHMEIVPRKGHRPPVTPEHETDFPMGTVVLTKFPPLGDWWKRAACRPGGPYAHVPMIPTGRGPKRRAMEAAAKAACARCPVRAECLEDALALPGYESVIAGGLTDSERDDLRRSRRTPAKDTVAA
jgi:WhiB family redox-sensing transcriptional regulator